MCLYPCRQNFTYRYEKFDMIKFSKFMTSSKISTLTSCSIKYLFNFTYKTQLSICTALVADFMSLYMRKQIFMYWYERVMLTSALRTLLKETKSSIFALKYSTPLWLFKSYIHRSSSFFNTVFLFLSFYLMSKDTL